MVVDKNELNRFYGKFWQSSANPRLPNEDEQLRLDAILYFIENHVLTGNKGKLNILDVGCGRGWMTSILSRFGTITGLEPVEAAAAEARGLFPHMDIRCGDMTQMLESQGNGTFDLVVASEVIEHVEDHLKKRFAEDICRLLTPGGFFILTTPRGELRQRWKRMYPDCDQPIEQWIGEQDLRRLMSSAGFSLVRSDRIFAPYFCWNWKARIVVSKKFRIIRDRMPWLPALMQRFKYECGLYQILLLKKGVL